MLGGRCGELLRVRGTKGSRDGPLNIVVAIEAVVLPLYHFERS